MSDEQTALQLMKQFNNEFVNYIAKKNEVNLDLILSKLLTKPLSEFDAQCTHSADFYCNIEELLRFGGASNLLIWKSISLLNNICKNEHICKFCVKHLRIFATISNILVNNQIGGVCLAAVDINYRQQLYSLVESISFEFQEPKLILHLVNTINEELDEKILQSALSILVNICYRNQCSINILKKSIKSTEIFIQKTEKFHILSQKIGIILCDHSNGYYPNYCKILFGNENLLFGPLTVSNLRHIHQSLLDICEYATNLFDDCNFDGIAKSLLKNLSEDTTEDVTYLAASTFRIFKEIIFHGNKSLKLNYYLLICKLAIIYLSAQSIDCIHQITLDDFQIPTYELEQLCAKVSPKNNSEINVQIMCSFLKFCVSNECKLLILNEEFFDWIFEKIQNQSVCLVDISDDELYMYLLSMKIECHLDIKNKLNRDLKNYLLSTGILSKKEEIIGIVFEVIQQAKLPTDSLSKLLANNMEPTITSDVNFTHKNSISIVAYEDTMANVFDRISQQPIDESDVDSIHLLELLRGEFNGFQAELANKISQITHLQQREALLSTKNAVYRNYALKSKIINNQLRNENAELLKMRKSFEDSFKTLHMKHIQLKTDIKILTSKNSEMNEQILGLQRDLETKNNKYQSLEELLVENDKKNTMLKTNLADLELKNSQLTKEIKEQKTLNSKYEGDMILLKKDIQAKLMVAETENARFILEIEDLNSQMSKFKTEINQLKQREKENNQETEELRKQLEETEELRKSIECLLSKKSKKN